MTHTAEGRSGLWGGVGTALVSAALFGLSTPFAKRLLGELPPGMLAGVLYLGAGIGLTILTRIAPGGRREASLTRANLPWLAGAIVFGGVAGPLLLMYGLARTPASASALLLNLEAVFTALLAGVLFREHIGRRVVLGMVAIVAGGIILSWQGRVDDTGFLGPALVAGACLCWAVDNNMTQRLSAANPLQIAAAKGAVAGPVNLALALVMGQRLPALPVFGTAVLVGFVGYGLSLAGFVVALRNLGTARTGAYFACAPFIGASASLLLLQEHVGPAFWATAGLMGFGVWLHLTEQHVHRHTHIPAAHDHRHSHDDHHRHEHEGIGGGEKAHAHLHEHAPETHEHGHFPDLHHRHGHDGPSGNDG